MRPPDAPAVTRRQFSVLSGVAVATALSVGAPATRADAAFSASPFQLGAAAGDATTTSVILWTRLALDPVAADAGMGGQPDSVSVKWAVYPSYAAAADGTNPVRSGSVTAQKAHHWSVHVEAGTAGTGSALRPGTRYWYVFSTAGATKTYRTWVGTFRTAPTASADVNARFAVFSCQNYINRDYGRSYWHGYDHINDEIDIADPDANASRMDFVVRLGDYIYEGGFGPADSAQGLATIPPKVCQSLTDYRQRWGWYVSRNSLQRMRRLYAAYVVPDDHELFNDINGARVATNFGESDARDAQLQRYNDALTAYWENQPLRGGPPTAPSGQDKLRLTITRTVRWGKHLTLMLWDCRQHRTRRSDPSPSVLGTAQRSQVLDLIQTSTSTWTTFGTTSPITSRTSPSTLPGEYTDGWLSYPEEREIITGAIKSRRASSDFNAVFIAGDSHCGVASTVRRTTDPDESSEVVAVEFAGVPMSSDGGDWRWLEDNNPSDLIRWVGYDRAAPTHTYKGYLRCSATADKFYANFVCGSDWLKETGTVSSKFTGRTTAGTVAVESI